MRLHSGKLEEGGRLPVSCTCDGEDRSPPLAWEGEPVGTKSYALIVDDPDAPRRYFVHWLVWNLDVDVRRLDPDIDPEEEGMVQGMNGFGVAGWRGPCPPASHDRHRYVFRLYALDALLDLPAAADRAALEQAMQGHILGQAELVTYYRRRARPAESPPP